ncbi:MAG: phage tail tube protein [Paenibacillus dendritiformis]|uniref:phage tail tube protein n=1 Tax=uncultured Paenibacillus sp. TaxID=227322 RepID=UPI0025CCBEB8|nr:phage tail tube protein [uncultured Paenibacillus sp.]MDU5141063.1 phage tail tube protein [Paenibacillus dendritiformis]
MPFLQAKDTISGQEGRAYAIIDGNREEMFYVKKIEAKAEKNKTEVKTLGRRGVQHKATGWSGSGSMTIYYVTSTFRKMMYNYIKNGKDIYFDVMVTNEDPTSSIGKQTVTLKNVNLDSVVMTSLDTEAEVLEEDVDFTFDDVDMDMNETFRAPVLG